MALAINWVSRVPAEPTTVPAMIMAALPSTKPSKATARPVRALYREMTTGMSAPPIGSVIITPKQLVCQTEEHQAIVLKSGRMLGAHQQDSRRSRDYRRGHQQVERCCWPLNTSEVVSYQALQFGERRSC